MTKWHGACKSMGMTHSKPRISSFQTVLTQRSMKAALVQIGMGVWFIAFTACDDTASAIKDRSRQEATEANEARQDAVEQVRSNTALLAEEAERSGQNVQSDIEVAKDSMQRDLNAGVEQTKEAARDLKSDIKEATIEAQRTAHETAQAAERKVDEVDKKVAEKIRGD